MCEFYFLVHINLPVISVENVLIPLWTDFVWSISNDVILSVSVDGSARLWAVASGTCMRVIDDEMGAHLLCCLFQPLNNNMFIVSSYGH